MSIKKAGCYCGNISVQVSLSKDLGQYTPRACDCDFCSRHGAAYISDPQGTLTLQVSDPAKHLTYRIGDNLIELHCCGSCGVFVAGTLRDGDEIRATLNSRALDDRAALAPAQRASPKDLSAEQKVERWRQLWFRDVKLPGH